VLGKGNAKHTNVRRPPPPLPTGNGNVQPSPLTHGSWSVKREPAVAFAVAKGVKLNVRRPPPGVLFERASDLIYECLNYVCECLNHMMFELC
jgi:hypothetical protein